MRQKILQAPNALVGLHHQERLLQLLGPRLLPSALQRTNLFLALGNCRRGLTLFSQFHLQRNQLKGGPNNFAHLPLKLLLRALPRPARTVFGSRDTEGKLFGRSILELARPGLFFSLLRKLVGVQIDPPIALGEMNSEGLALKPRLDGRAF